MLSQSDGRVEQGGGGTDRHTDTQTHRHTDTQRDAAAVYNRHLTFRLYGLLDVVLREHFRGSLEAP